MITTSPSLLERVRAERDVQSWNRFIDLYTPLLFAWAGRLGLDRHDAADLAQDVLTALVQKLPTFRYDARLSFRAWLKSILLNRWRNRVRTAGRLAVADPAALAEVPAEVETPFLEAEEYRQAVARRALGADAGRVPADHLAGVLGVRRPRPTGRPGGGRAGHQRERRLPCQSVLRRLREELSGLLD
ncbi:MAG: RNA polymerase sigma factor [Gemmataceae bacterium]